MCFEPLSLEFYTAPCEVEHSSISARPYRSVLVVCAPRARAGQIPLATSQDVTQLKKRGFEGCVDEATVTIGPGR